MRKQLCVLLAIATIVAMLLPTTALAVGPQPPGKYVVVADGLNVRLGPGTEFTAVSSFNTGTLLSVLGWDLDQNGRAWALLVGGYYVAGWYIQPTSGTTFVPPNQKFVFDANTGAYMMDGVADGSKDVTIDAVMAKSVAFKTSVPGYIIFCVGALNVNSVALIGKSNCDGIPVNVDAGQINIVSSTGPIGGVRWSPVSGTGWRVSNPTSCPPLDGLCWKQQTNGSWSWEGAVDGSADVHQAAIPDVLTWIRAGGVVTLTTTVPTELVGTCVATVTLNGKLAGQHTNCSQIYSPILLEPGTIVIAGSTGEQGGWRLRPQAGFGWRAVIDP